MSRAQTVKGVERVPNRGRAGGWEAAMSHDYRRKKTGQTRMEDLQWK